MLFNFDVFWNRMELFLPWDCGLDWAHRSEIRLYFSLDAKPLIFRPQALEWLWEMERLLEGLHDDDAYCIYSYIMGSKPLSVLLLLLELYCLSFSFFICLSCCHFSTAGNQWCSSASVIETLEVIWLNVHVGGRYKFKHINKANTQQIANTQHVVN